MKVLIFGGTTEGRKLSEALSGAGYDVTLSVATEFGRNMAARNNSGIGINSHFISSSSTNGNKMAILANRLDKYEIIDLLRQNTFDYVIDATHPYAVLATLNIKSACKVAGFIYIRLKRPGWQEAQKDIFNDNSYSLKNSEISYLNYRNCLSYVTDSDSAVEMLNQNNDNILLTTGSKGLEQFTRVNNFAERLYIRILPMEDSLKKAVDLGFPGSNIICMQGPFDNGMNVAMLKMTGAKYLVTKDSGKAGGFEAKVSAALELDCKVIVIGRPGPDEGYTFSELLGMFNVKNGKELQDEASEQQIISKQRNVSKHYKSSEQAKFFPMFIEIKNKKVLVIGGGNIAERRIKILVSFGADITVISPVSTEYIKTAASQGILSLIERKHQNGDIVNSNPLLVIAATDDRRANHSAMIEATNLDIPISVADCREECTCYFPAIAENDNYTAGLVSKDGNYAGVKQMAQKIRGLLNS